MLINLRASIRALGNGNDIKYCCPIGIDPPVSDIVKVWTVTSHGVPAVSLSGDFKSAGFDSGHP